MLARNFSLPKLEGTPKQVHWAAGIRWSLLNSALDLIEAGNYPEGLRSRVIDITIKRRKASTWIDRRFEPLIPNALKQLEAVQKSQKKKPAS